MTTASRRVTQGSAGFVQQLRGRVPAEAGVAITTAVGKDYGLDAR
jgi:hypothetical protein